MAMFVHLAAESSLAAIKRGGISRLRKSREGYPGGVYAVPLTRNFYMSHQWLRELKRRNAGPIAGVYFRIPDDESVWVGRYSGSHERLTATEAVARFMACELKEGWEVIIPRRIDRSEIHRV
ncbi:MAG: hypothetical protein JWM57_4220, partial [Phycisphaerales bacterium]|nr:hypothetical protein [Phycisphaerales bacterium]